MDDWYFLSTTEMSKFECILDKSQGICLGCNLERLHNTRIYFMLDPWKLSLCIFPNNCNIHIGVSSFDARMREAKVNICKQVKMFVEFMIIVIFCFDTFFRYHDSQQNTSIFLKSISLFEIFECKISNEIKIHWNICSPKNFYHTILYYIFLTCNFWADSNTRNKSNRLMSTILRSMKLSSCPDRIYTESILLESR